MAYCKNCGAVLVDGAKFCQKCGTKVDAAAPNSSTRQQEYAGTMYKCPRCGEVLESFVSNCPACGLELRGTKATSSVREFALKLEAIEASRRFEIIPQFSSQAEADKFISSTDQQKISLIENFAVPNTKEDILEFMILATSNIDASAYGTTEPTRGQKAMANAWYSKIKQTYIKAKNAYGSARDFAKIQNLYDECSIDIKQQKKRKIIKWSLMFGWFPILIIAFIIFLNVYEDVKIPKETARLNAIVEEIREQLENKEYKYALMNTDHLVWYNSSHEDSVRKWQIEREYWVDTILEQAANDGIILDRPSDPLAPTPTPYDNTQALIDAFETVFSNEQEK